MLPERILSASRGLLSFGLSDEWGFEREFWERTGAPTICYDPTVNARFWFKRSITCIYRGILALDPKAMAKALKFIEYMRFFYSSGDQAPKHIRKYIGYRGSHTVDLNGARAESAISIPFFLKVDIEGSEYRILDQIAHSKHELTGLAIEFHDVDLHEQRIVNFIDAISDVLVVVHFHANSHTVVEPNGRALAIELTFMNRELLREGETLLHQSLPIAALDYANLPGEAEANVSFACA